MIKIVVVILCGLFPINILLSQIGCLEIIDAERIISIADDNEFIWCGTEGDGLLRINKSNFSKTYWNTSNSNISANRIKSVLIYKDNLHLSSDSTLMGLENNNIYSISDTIEGLLIQDSQENLLIAGRRHFYIMDSVGTIIYNQNLMEIVQDACCSQITDIDIDSENNIWLSHKDFYEYDILKLDGVLWSVFDMNNSILPIESPFPNQITANNNSVFASNASGLYKFENHEWVLEHSSDNPTIENNQDNINGLSVSSVESDKNEILWIAANNYSGENWGKIAFRNNESWNFVYNDSNNFSEINLFQESITDPNILFVGTRSGLAIIDINCLTTNTDIKEKMNTESIKIYPVPSNGFLNISYYSDIKRIELYDVMGKFLRPYNIQNNQIDLTSLNRGIYLLKIYSENDCITEKIIKE